MTLLSTRYILTTTLAIGLLGLAAQGGAATKAATDRQRVVTFADINLSNQAGAITLYKRLGKAARQVCSDPKSSLIQNLEFRSSYRTCVAGAIANAVTSVDQPALTVEHLARTNRSQTKRVAANL
jgi:UrcA family protein